MACSRLPATVLSCVAVMCIGWIVCSMLRHRPDLAGIVGIGISFRLRCASAGYRRLRMWCLMKLKPRGKRSVST